MTIIQALTLTVAKIKLFAIGATIAPMSNISMILFHKPSAAFLMLALVDARRLATIGITFGEFFSMETLNWQ